MAAGVWLIGAVGAWAAGCWGGLCGCAFGGGGLSGDAGWGWGGGRGRGGGSGAGIGLWLIVHRVYRKVVLWAAVAPIRGWWVLRVVVVSVAWFWCGLWRVWSGCFEAVAWGCGLRRGCYSCLDVLCWGG